jgi:hypothetical protein
MRHVFVFITLLAISTGFLITPACALVIDDFTFGQGALAATNASPDVSGNGFAPPANTIGFERDVRLQRITTGAIQSSVVFFTSPSPLVQITPGNSTGVNVTFQWDGLLDGPGAGKNVLDPTGLIPTANLIGPGANLISVTASNGASPATAEFTIRDSANIISTNTLVIPPLFNGDLQFFFDDFDTPVNFFQAEAMQLKLTVPVGTTFYLSGVLQSEYLFTGTPEPSTAILMVPMLAGMAWRRRRRNALAKSA